MTGAVRRSSDRRPDPPRVEEGDETRRLFGRTYARAAGSTKTRTISNANSSRMAATTRRNPIPSHLRMSSGRSLGHSSVSIRPQ